MTKKVTAGKIILTIAVVILAALLLCAVIYPRAARAVWSNLTSKSVRLPKTDDWTGGKTYMKVPFAADSENQYLDLYVPDMKDGETPPLYVIIHGGGFVSNDSQSKQAQLMYRYFRDHGYACATVNYRLADEAPFPGALCDCKAAIRYLRAHAGEYGYNAEHIAVFGESAGGYLAVMCAVTDDSEFSDVRFIDEDAYEGTSAQVDMLVDYYGHIDNEGADADWQQLGIPSPVLSIANSWISGKVLQGYENVESLWFRKNVSKMTAEEKAVVNPYTYIDSHDLANLSVFIIHGDADITVPYLQSERLSAYLEEKLGPDKVRYLLYPRAGHAADSLYSEEVLDGVKEFLDNEMKGRVPA